MTTLLWFLFAAAFFAGLVAVVLGSILARALALRRGDPYFLASAAFLLLALSVVEVDAGVMGVVKRFGNPVREAPPGLHFIVPFIEYVQTVATQTRIVHPNEDAASLDLQVVHTEVTLAYHVDPAYATFVLVNLNNEAEDRVIKPAILEAIKATTAKYNVQDLISQRPRVRDGIEDFVKSRVAPYHIIAENTSITDFSFSQQFENAIEAKVTAQQQAEKADNDLKRIKIEAEQKIAQAQGEAEALRSQKQEITPELLQLRTIEMMRDKWDGHFPQVISGTLPMLDVLKSAGR